MKAFKFDDYLIGSYERFSRSFSSIKSDDLRHAIDEGYNNGRFWPDALLSLNPYYEDGMTVDELVASNVLDAASGSIFRANGSPIRFRKHQEQAIAKAKSNKSFVVTTGTGSGKSLCFFVPIVDAIVRARRAGKPASTKAIIIYPMNALANSQLKEIRKFVDESGLPSELRPTISRYTGQENQEERQRIAHNPPDILLTNYMMAELLLTRQDALDARVIGNASGLEFIVLDELHTYRGRQGADVAVLLRRLKDRCTPEREPICVGTSATMATEGSDESRAAAVAQVASRLFGADIGPDAIIDESLRRATNDTISLSDILPKLSDTLSNPPPARLDDNVLQDHPLAIWVEMALGLDDGQELKRKRPIPFEEAVAKLSEDSGVDIVHCRTRLQEFLTAVSLPEGERGGTGAQAFLAFKLHRFISGAGEVFTTLIEPPRPVYFEGQLEDPDAPGNRLYPTRFCRNCGHEYHVVTKTDVDGQVSFLPRSIDDQPLEEADDDDVAGYLCPIPEASDLAFDGDLETLPESWLEERNGVQRLRSYRKKRVPVGFSVSPDGRSGAGGRDFWFIPGKFAFCLSCKDEPNQGMRERSKLAGLSGEGRSSATTLLVSSALEWMNSDESGVPEDKRKLLGFTDNRQDAALQSGHFNDFLFISLLRGALLRAVEAAGPEGLSEDEFGLRLVKALGFTETNKKARVHWMLDPSAGAVIRQDAQRALAKVLAHRVWTDLRRGWRYTNPSLSVLKLIRAEFVGIADMACDSERLGSILPELLDIDESERVELLRTVLAAMLEGLAVDTEALDLAALDTVAQKSRSLLRSPWSIDQKEDPRGKSALIVKAIGKANVRLREEKTLLRAGPSSRIARLINNKRFLGARLSRDDFAEFFDQLLGWFSDEGLIVPVDLESDLTGWRLNPAAIRLVAGPAISDPSEQGNAYFHNLYQSIASDLAKGESSYWGLEGREHTAQVSQKQREWREWRFRFEDDDKAQLASSEFRNDIRATGESDQFLPALFCSPTMELGVDISAMNAVYLRNVPPTPANYAQRAGRSGRSGQAAVVVTYCASGSPHDQYFFDRRNDMVAGVVRPPALDITNEELVASHLHAVWLAETGLALNPDIPEILDLMAEGYPLKEEILTTISSADLETRVKPRMASVLNQILAADGGVTPPWMDGVTSYVDSIATDAPLSFDRAFNRWRELYDTARTQLAEANKRSEIAGLSRRDRNAIRSAQIQASDQISILEQGNASNGSDFYSYRYLATEGFLPGYNFPRLPLYAFVPGEGKSGSYLSRARFVAISEFGPRSLIYHEGRSYRVTKAKLPPAAREGDGSELATKDIYICSNCGACHEGEVERCHACNAHMAGELPIKRTLRIDNVEAAPTERITANDEERVRQGFDIQTVFSWPERVTNAEFKLAGETLLSLQYANSAEISRLNKGLKRRRDQTVFGFNIDPRSGYWAKSEDEEQEGERPPDAVRPVRIVPIVRDSKNALHIRFAKPEALEPETAVTLQQAILRGIAVVYQLEEGEILGEPLPSKDNRRAILAYEATEGGAGVLARLINEPSALGGVARTALDLMHYDNVDAAVSAGDPDLLKEREDEACVRGCYRCLLSYFNQMDHEHINRLSREVLQMLIDLARGETIREPAAPSSPAGTPWQKRFEESRIRQADSSGMSLGGQAFEYVWRSHLVAASTSPIAQEALEAAEEKGFELIELSEADTEAVLKRLAELLRE